MNTKSIDKNRHYSGFSLIELLVSMGILSLLLVILMGALSAMSTFYVTSDVRTQAEEKGRAIIELFSREVTPAVIDTRMQFVIMPGHLLTDAGALDVVDSSPALLWMAPLGPGGDLRCIGYFLTGNHDKKQYRLKRIYIKDDNPHGYFPRMVNLANAQDTAIRTSPVDADWFTGNWDNDAFDDVKKVNDKLVVSTVSGEVVAFWVRALDPMGNPIRLLSSSDVHPASDLTYNSAAYFYMADGKPFDDGTTFAYLKKNKLTMKANRLPAALEFAIVTMGEDDISRGKDVPAQVNVIDNASGTLDLASSIRDYTNTLQDAGYSAPRVFRTTVKLTNGG